MFGICKNYGLCNIKILRDYSMSCVCLRRILTLLWARVEMFRTQKKQRERAHKNHSRIYFILKKICVLRDVWDDGHFSSEIKDISGHFRLQDDTLHSGSEVSESGERVFHTRIMRCSFHMRTKHISTHKGRAWGGVRTVIMNYMMWWAVVWISYSL